MVMAQSLYITIKQQSSLNMVDVVAPVWSQPLLARMPQVRNAIALHSGHGQLSLATRYRLGRRLRQSAYQKAIVLPRSLKAALVPFIAKVPERVGYRGEYRYGFLTDIRPLDKSVLMQTVQRYVALALPRHSQLPPPVPKPLLSVDRSNRAALVAKLGLDDSIPVVGMMPGAEYGPAKRWPVEYYTQLATKLLAEGYAVWVLGSEKEHALGERIAAVDPGIRNLCGKTRLVDVVDLLSLPQAVVTNDSGLMHVAAAVGTNVIALYGSSTPEYTPPLTDKAMILYDNLSCSPCFKRECPYGHTRCLTDISVDRVFGAIKQSNSTVQDATQA
jgi:heptosyltransferase-2